MVAIDSFSCLFNSLTSNRVSMVGSLIVLAGCLAAERLSTLVGVTLRVGSLDTILMIGVDGTRTGFALSSTSGSSICRCACCKPIKVGANQLIVLLRA